MLIKQKSSYTIKLTLDLLIINIAFILAAVVSQSSHILLVRNYMFLGLFALNVIWHFTSNSVGLYEDLATRSISSQFFTIIRLVVYQALSLLAFIFIIKEDFFTRNFVTIFTLSVLGGVAIRTLAVKFLQKSFRSKGINVRKLIIIGTGETAKGFSEMIEKSHDMGYDFSGFITTDTTEKGENILGSLDNLVDLIPQLDISEAIIALPVSETDTIEKILKVCNKYAVRTHIIPDYFRFLSRKFHVSMIGEYPIITVRTEPLEQIEWRFVKRLFDLFISGMVFLTVIWWLFPIIALIQKLTSPGPVFYNQERIGRGGKLFTCYKFRTMRTDIVQGQFAAVLKDDDRITKFGKILRKSNLDELPQVLNVLIGDMSIVGPRPHAVAFDKRYEEFLEEIRLRNLVKPGLTGWASAYGLRGDSAEEEENKRLIKKRFDYDIRYIEDWSFMLDIYLIFLTAWNILAGKLKGK